jgi:hypothetical protein
MEKQCENNKNSTPDLMKRLNQKELEDLVLSLYSDNSNLIIDVLKRNVKSYSDFFKLFENYPIILLLIKKHIYSNHITALNIICEKMTNQIYEILTPYFNEFYNLSHSKKVQRKTWDSFFLKWLLQVDTESISATKMLKLSDDIMKDLKPIISGPEK